MTDPHDGPPTEAVPIVDPDDVPEGPDTDHAVADHDSETEPAPSDASVRSADSPFPDADDVPGDSGPLYPLPRTAGDREPDSERSDPGAGLYPTPPRQPRSAQPPFSPAEPARQRGVDPRAQQRASRARPPGDAPPRQRSRPPAQPRPQPPDYYLGTDWLRVAVGTLASLILLVSIGGLGYYLFDRIETDESQATPTSTPSVATEVEVFKCAGDVEVLTRQPPPQAELVGGRNAAGTWLAFRNLQPPPKQLWVRAQDLPAFDPATVGVVSCASSDSEFPEPVGAPTPTAVSAVDAGATPFPTSTPRPTATAVPLATATPQPPTPTPSG